MILLVCVYQTKTSFSTFFVVADNNCTPLAVMKEILAALLLLPVLTRSETWDYRDVNLIDHACYLAKGF